MTNYKLRVVRKPLPTNYFKDIKPSFPKLDNLFLNLLENKKKIKPNLPLIPMNTQPKKVEIVFAQPEEKSSKNEEKPINKINELKEETDSEEEEAESPVQIKKPSENVSQKKQEVLIQEDPKEEKSKEEEIKEEEPVDPRSQEEIEEEERQDHLVKLRILKKANPSFEIPAYTEHTDLITLKRIYKDSVHMINLDRNVDSYKTFLTGGFILMEVLGSKMGINLKGFAKFQMKKKDKYDSLLVELGEKSHMSFTSNWPVEARLLGMLLFDAAIFYLGKILSESSGAEGAQLLNLILGTDFGTQGKKMRGPSVNVEDVKNMNKKNN